MSCVILQIPISLNRVFGRIEDDDLTRCSVLGDHSRTNLIYIKRRDSETKNQTMCFKDISISKPQVNLLSQYRLS